VLRARGRRLTWRLPMKVSRYVLETRRQRSGMRLTSYRLVKGTGFTPPAVPGHTMKYRLRADRRSALWSNVVPIKYSPKSAPAPASAPVAARAPVDVAAATPAPVTPAASGPMMVGLNAGWGTTSASDMRSTFGLARINTTLGGTEVPGTYHADGIKVIATFPGDVNGDYDAGGVSAINVSSWVNMAMTYYASQCAGSTNYCAAIEVLNEPFGTWFWGPDADSAENGRAYAKLVQTVYLAFQSKYGAAAPKILAAYDPDQWWSGMLDAVPNITSFFDGVVVHAYGGTGSRASSALGARWLVTEAHNSTGKPVWVTEFGWPTALGQPATEDSLQWNETEQADNIYSFVNWARSTGYVAAATYFNFRDYGSNQWYGVERSTGGDQYAKKPGWYALAESSAGQSCTVC
jgi:Glycosyl hydrolase catalytic core